MQFFSQNRRRRPEASGASSCGAQTRHGRLQLAQRGLVAGVGAAVHVSRDGVASQRHAPPPAGLGRHRTRHRRRILQQRRTCREHAITGQPRRPVITFGIAEMAQQRRLPRRCNRGTDPLPPTRHSSRRRVSTSPPGSRVTLASVPVTRRTPETGRVRREIGDIGRLVEMKAVGEARGQGLRITHGPGEAPEAGGHRRQRVVLRSFEVSVDGLQHQVLVEGRAADVAADLAVRMQEAAAVALPSEMFGGELERGPGATHEVVLGQP